ncbi:hypothetical protein OsJ_20804 [Oryza sativa Japonica Group]|uniref:Hexosyltransferase n=1 Tax=Oryza sativa subsp. japonica TaxID=39947 RepID=B9FSI1_ORYSJ|nr:hypothetical protein OsJ_20804 [Oryza sativa Japonica Group]
MPARAAAAAAAVALLLAVCAQAAALPRFAEAPEYRNGEGCPAAATAAAGSLFFHFLAEEEEVGGGGDLRRAVAASFPSLRFEIYAFRAEAVAGLISASVRAALESPLNYARNHLADLLPRCVPRAIYLDSDVLAVDDVRRLWETRLPAAAVVAAPEYCHANFSRYFTPAFWSDPGLGRRVFAGRRRPPCYFNTGVMVIDLRRWRAGNYRHRIERWMEIQKEKRIYELGSLPPFLLVFAGEVEAVDHRLEPARPRRRQRARQLPPAPRRAGQPHALVRQGEAMGPPRRRQPVPARPHLEVLRPLRCRGRRRRRLLAGVRAGVVVDVDDVARIGVLLVEIEDL